MKKRNACPQRTKPWLPNTPRFNPLNIGWVTLFLPGAFAVQAESASVTNETSFTTSAGITVKEVVDSNVYMQEHGPLANHLSPVTMAIPSLSLHWKPSTAFSLDASYAPELASYLTAHSEDYVAHKAALKIGGLAGTAIWEANSSINWIQGNSKSPTYYWNGPAPGPGVSPIPVLGQVPLRDRRDAAIYRDNLKFQQPMGDWFVRPVASAYIHDFMTEHKNANPAPGLYYANYVDRDDFNGGLDAGYMVMENMDVFLGYRYGAQHQSQVNATDPAYSNHYQRALAGIEGTPVKWLRLNASLGPDFRSFFGPHIPSTFDRHRTRLFVDASATVIPTPQDTITLGTKRSELPGYVGKSVFEDISYEATWKHQFTKQLSLGLGFRALNWFYENPVNRVEWWYGVATSASYRFNTHLSAEVAYSYDQVVSHTPDPATANWEAQRHLASLGLQYQF